MFDALITSLKEETVRTLYHIRLAEKIERKEVAKPVSFNRSEDTKPTTKINKEKKVYPNDPCPCGSGKKYKNCHGKIN